MTDPAVVQGSHSATREGMRALFDRVAQECELPPLPAVAVRAIALLRDPDTKARDLVQLVATDGAIAARVLRISRSVTYLRREPPRTLEEAVRSVGFDALRTVLIIGSASTAYQRTGETPRLLWSHALATALAADELAALADRRRGGCDFIAGLLHDVGRLVFHLADPAAYARLGHSDEQLETELFGVPHAAVGACLAEQWGLEDELVEALMFHHAPTSSTAARLARADRIAHQIGFASVPAIDASLHDEAAACSDDDLTARVARIFETERANFE